MSKLHVAQASLRLSCHRRTGLSFCEVLDCANLSLDGLVCSLDASVEVAVSDKTFFADNFGWDVRAGNVLDVNDAWFSFAL